MTSRPWVTWGVAAASVALTVAWWRDALPALPRGAEGPALTVAEDYLLATLLHVDPIHLLFNLSWVWQWGPTLERRHGPAGVVALLVWLSVGTGGAEHLLAANGVGLSGVIYGLLTFLWVSERSMPAPARLVSDGDLKFFAGWFVFCVVVTQLGLWRVGNVAHGSGAVLGWVAGEAWQRGTAARWAAAILVPAAAIAAAVVV